MMELSALRHHINLGHEARCGLVGGTTRVYHASLGEFEGELGSKYHMMVLASTTSAGIKLRWWIETLIKVREEEGCVSGPAFGNSDGSAALMREYNKKLHQLLEQVHKENPELISEGDNMHANYGFSCTF